MSAHYSYRIVVKHGRDIFRRELVGRVAYQQASLADRTVTNDNTSAWHTLSARCTLATIRSVGPHVLEVEPEVICCLLILDRPFIDTHIVNIVFHVECLPRTPTQSSECSRGCRCQGYPYLIVATTILAAKPSP